MGGGRVRGGGKMGGMRDGGNRLYLKKGGWKTITLSV